MRTADFKNKVTGQKTVWTGGCFDALSAKLIERAGFDAVMTSGFGVSASLLGMPDAELYTMTENSGVVRNVASAVDIPVIADMDTGYGNAINVMRSVREFEQTGASAVILEDQVSPKRCPICVSGVEVIGRDEAAKKVAAAVEARRDPNMLIIARTDASTVDEAILRAKEYVAAGADIVQPISGTFKSLDDLKRLREAAGVPLSLQILGWLEQDLSAEDIESVAGLAVYPLIALMTAAEAMSENLAKLRAERSSANLPHARMDHHEFIDMIGFSEVERLQLKYLKNDAESAA
ncbi:oxaloacetate decarboxylase [Paracoccus sp. SCSIO 75233]|uniref:isocitrate lyase/PEP mutase family protein n=1 Tax=Paracoccus sp. SCSIO 75233 TaxID=3017782 RepID=UPI0022F12599|nr:isocitrate lyase/PEP mutase family protein [Paracoccus sp. SCSIO 75233]WBU52984.1 isocitrate lyase/PEP mutase family protein [Paracoccus sp. SCSIO 75233]